MLAFIELETMGYVFSYKKLQNNFSKYLSFKNTSWDSIILVARDNFEFWFYQSSPNLPN